VFILGLLAAAIFLYLAMLTLIIRFSLSPKRLPYFISPGMMGLPQRDVELRSKDDVKLRAWWSAHPEPKGVVLLTHGYIMNRSEMTPVGAWFFGRGYNMMVLDFRAHGRSGSKRTTLGYLERFDVLAAVEWIREECLGLPLVVVGSSMGAAAAAMAHAFEDAEIDALVLDSAYSRLDYAILGWWRFLGGKTLEKILYPSVWIGGLIMPFKLHEADVAKALAMRPDTPTLILHGDCDDLATPSEATRNLEATRNGELVWFERCSHSEGRMLHPDRYFGALSEFLGRHGLPS